MTFTPTVLLDCVVIINSNTLSDHANKAELNVQVVDLDTTAFGATYKARTGGLKDGTVTIDFIQDFTASNLDSIMWALLGTVVTFEVRPTSSSRSTSNPGYTGSILIKEWKPIMGSVGGLTTVSCSFPTSGVVTRNTS